MRYSKETLPSQIFISGLLIALCLIIPELSHAQETTQRISALQKRIQLGADSLYLQLGNLYLDMEEWGKADDSFSAYLQHVNKNPAAFVGRGRALHGKGKSAFIPVEAIKKLFKIDNFSKAQVQFERALKEDSNFIDAYYWLSLNYLAKGNSGNYKKAVGQIQSVLQRDSLYLDADFVLGVAYQHLKNYHAAEEIFKAVIGKHRFIAKSSIRLSEVLLEQNRGTEAISYFYDGISHLEEAKMLEELYAQLETLMSKEQKNTYTKLPIEERGDFFRQFWKSKDPTPTTEKNERYETHYNRVKIALASYSDIIPPYYDDRGKIFVKYGAPDDRYISKIYMNGVKQNESWTYERSIRPGLTFDFVRKGNSYRHVISLMDAAPAGASPTIARQYASDLYMDRISLSESYTRIFSTPNFNNAMTDFQAERGDAQAYAPAEHADFKLPGKKIEFVYSASRFMGINENQISTEFYFAIPLNQLSYRHLTDQSFLGTLAYSMMIQDSAYHTIDKRTGRIPIAANSKAELAGSVFIYQENFNLDPGQYRFAVRIENPEGDARGLYTNDIQITPYASRDVKLSDIQLASRIDPANEEAMRFVKHELQVTPYPYRTLRVDQPIYLYFEGYNLTLNESGQSEYTITYHINMLKQKRGLLSKTFGAVGRIFSGGTKGRVGSSYVRQGNKRSAIEYLAIDLGKMKEGSAEVVLTLKDNVSGKTDQQSIALQLIKPQKH